MTADKIYLDVTTLFAEAEGEVELAWSDPGKDAPCHAEHFPLTNEGLWSFAERAVEINEGGKNTYLIPAALRPGVEGRACNEDVIHTTVLWADVDNSAVAASPAARCGSCPPSITVITRPDPGRRVHLYWHVHPPITDRDVIRRLNRQIAAHLGADMAATNPARLMRVPGTRRWGTEKKPREPHYLQAWCSGTLYEVEDVEAQFPVTAQRRNYGVCGASQKWSTFFAEPIGEGARNAQLFRLCGKLLSRRLDPDFAHDITQACNAVYCEPPLDEAEVEALVDSCCKTALRGMAK